MTHESISQAGDIHMGPFNGSSFPDKIAELSDKCGQIIWKTAGLRVAFDESALLDPDVWSAHKAVVFRLAGATEVTDVSFTDDMVVVAKRPGYDSDPTSVRAYSRGGIDRNYDIPPAVTIGTSISLLSGLCAGELKAVNELLQPRLNDSHDSLADEMLTGFRVHGAGTLFPNIPHVSYEASGKGSLLLEESARKLASAVDRVGLIAVQTNGVVIR